MSFMRRLVLLVVLTVLLLAGLSGREMMRAVALAAAPPTITSLSPAFGPILSGTQVVITGTDFVGVTAVDFGTRAALSYTVDSSTQITAVASGNSAGPVDLTVTAEGGTATAQYTYVIWPTITSISPASGPGTGGSTVVITGTGFKGFADASAVYFGGLSATSFTVDSDTQITAITPAHAAGFVEVTVTAAGGPTQHVYNSTDDYFSYAPTGTPDQFSITRITNNSYQDVSVQVSGDRLVWLGRTDGTHAQVFTWTPTSGIVQLTSGARERLEPRVSGDRVVWWAPGGSDGGADYEIFTWTPSSGIVQLTKNNVADTGARVSGDRVVWAGDVDGNDDICTWTPSGGTVVVTSGGRAPEVSGDRIVWQTANLSNDLCTWVPPADFHWVWESSQYWSTPAVSGDRIACATGSGFFTWTPSSGDQIVVASGVNVTPSVSGDRIAFTSDPYYKAYTWAPSEGITRLSAGTTRPPVVSGDRVVWGALTGSYYQMFEWTPIGGTVQITTNSRDNGHPAGDLPAISGDRIAWVSGGSGTTDDIYTAVVTVPAGSTRYDQFNNSNIAKTGTWTDYPATGAYQGSYGRSSTADASATVYFTGTKIAWIGMKGSTPGIVDVYLDDVKKATIDLYASPAQYQVPVWTSDTLPNGPHHMKLVRNPGSVSTEYIVLDAVDILGTIAPAPPAITSLSPASGSPDGGTSVTISGSGFAGLSGPAAVTFGGVNATNYSVVDSTKITAVAPAHAAATVRVQVTTGAGTTPDTPADDFTYSVAPPTTRVDVPSTTTPGFIWSGTWAAYASTSAHGGSYMRASTSAGYATVAFSGTRLDWIATTGTTTGKADVYLDGATVPVTVDLYKSPIAYQKNVYTTGTLPDGYHMVKIKKNPGATSAQYITIDAVEVAGTLVPTRKEQTDPLLVFNPALASWTTGTTTSASGGTYKYINTLGASITINFTGISLDIIAKKSTNYGKIKVTLDGTTTFTVDLYASAASYKQRVWTSGYLSPGNHTVKIERLGTKNASSTGNSISFDAIDVVGVLK